MKRVHSFTVPSASGGATIGAVGEGTLPSAGGAAMVAVGEGTLPSVAAPGAGVSSAMSEMARPDAGFVIFHRFYRRHRLKN